MYRILQGGAKTWVLFSNGENNILRMSAASKILFSDEKIIFISSNYGVMFFLLYGQKSEQANREHINLAENTHIFHAVHIW